MGRSAGCLRAFPVISPPKPTIPVESPHFSVLHWPSVFYWFGEVRRNLTMISWSCQVICVLGEEAMDEGAGRRFGARGRGSVCWGSDGEGPDCLCSRAWLGKWNVWVHGVQEDPLGPIAVKQQRNWAVASRNAGETFVQHVHGAVCCRQTSSPAGCGEACVQ